MKMKSFAYTTLIMAALLTHNAFAAKFYKCQDNQGNFIYSQVRCDSASYDLSNKVNDSLNQMDSKSTPNVDVIKIVQTTAG